MQEEVLKGYRLSPQQRHLWRLLERDREVSYQTKCAVAINGRLENCRLKTAAQNVIARHEILRTTFQRLPGMTIPMQVIKETGDFSWREDDLSGLAEQESLIAAFFDAASQPFDFEQGPVLDLHLVKKAEDDHVLIARLPAICADAVSLQNLVGELGRSYATAASGEELASDVAQYADLAEWLNELIEAEETRFGREYWQNLNLLRPPTPQLAFEGVPTSEAAFAPRLEELKIAPPLAAGIESFARSKKTSPEQILLACWYILLWRHMGQSEIEIGTVFDGRRDAEIKDALGLFAKYLPVTCRLEEGLQFSELIEQIDESFLTVQDRQEYFSWEQIVEPQASAPSTSFFPFCFEPESLPAIFSAGEVSFTTFNQYACIDRFKVKLSHARRSGGSIIEFHYNSELFGSADIRCLIGHFQTLLESVIADPARKIGELEMVSDDERQQLFFEYNATQAEWPREKFLPELFREQVELRPEAVAVIHHEAHLTYYKLNERAIELARYLRRLGVGPEVVVGLAMERSFDLVVSLLAVLKAGGAYLPLDPSYPQARLAFMLEDAAVTVLLTETHLSSRLPSTKQVRVVCVDALWELISQPSAQDFETRVLPDNLAYIIYTSGSTGRPKGVMLRHASLANYLLWAINHYPLGVGSGAPVHSSLSFDLTVTALFTPLLVGGYIHLLSAENEIEALGAAMGERPGYGLVKLTPAHLQLLSEQLGMVDLDGAARSLVIGGENLPVQTVRWWRERALATRLFNEYGPTESVVGCSVYEVGTQVEVEEGRATVPIGRPIANTSLYILDGRQQPTPRRVIGELCIGGEGLARGYLNRPDLTAERFVPHAYSKEVGARLYRTGDLARYLRDVQIECLGRTDEQVKLRGYRIEPGEIEALLCEHPGVRQSAVVMREDEAGLKRLVAYVVASDWYSPPPGAYVLPNGVAVAQQNKNEAEYLYREIFERQIYLRHGIEMREESCVFDVGANIGMFTIFVGEHCPGARVYAFEPIAEIHRCLTQNAARYGARMRVFPYGLSDCEQEVQFTYYPRFSMMSRREDSSNQGEDKELVKRYLQNERRRGVEGSEELLAHADQLLAGHFEGQARACRLRRLSDVMKEQGVERIDLLKIDVEHSEEAVLRGIEDEDWEKIDQIVLEAHDEDGTGGSGRVREIIEKLEGRGYVVEAEEDEHLRGTGLYNLYARRKRMESTQKTEPAMSRRETRVAGAVLTAAELREYLKRRLPEYMVPGVFVALKELPLTPNGKVDRKALPRPEQEQGQGEMAYVAPRTPVEEILAGFFGEVLKLDRVGISDNFFQIGGHSLLATRVISRVKKTFGVEIGVGSIFEKATVEGLAKKIEEAMRAGEKEEAPPMGRASREGKLPLSFAQQRLWFLDQLVPDNPFYNIPGAVRLEGRLDVEVLERVINEIVRRHEVLRTRFEVEEGEPVQAIDPWMPRKLERIDLTSLPPGEREAEARRIASAEAEAGFDLSQGPLLRVKVLKLDEAEHLVLYTMHHIVSDGWSMGILIREVGTLYQAYCAGQSSPLDELEIQYVDFAVWQREWLQGGVLAAELAYWRKQLAGIEDLELPIDHPRPAVRSYLGARQRFVVGKEVAQKLRELSQREGASLFMVLLGGFDVLMSRYSGQADVVVGTDIANRNRAEIEGLIGFFVNQLVLRVEVRARESFAGLLKRVREVCLGAYGHQDVPFEKLVEELEPERDPSRSPLFQAKLIMQNAERGGLELEGLRLSSGGGVEVRTTRLDLTVSITDMGTDANSDMGRDLVGAVTYSRDLFEAETISRLMSHYTNVLREILEALERPISELRLLSEAEREQVVVEWNQTGRPYPNDRCIHEIFREQAVRTPERMALVCEDQGLSYREINRRANQLAAHLQGLGVGPEVVVGLCLERSVEMVVALLGVLKAGGAYLPLDAESPVERLALMLEDAGAGVVLTERKLERRLPAFLGQTVLIDEEWERIAEQSQSEPESEVVAGNPAYLIYTSGSTGKPKGVVIEHRNLVNYTAHMCRRLGVGEGGESELAFAAISTITADLGNTCIYPSLVSGGCLHVLSYEAATDGVRFGEYLRRNPIDVLKIVPSHLGALLGSGTREERMLPWKYLILGGEALPPDLVERIWERAEGCEVINHYGPTETTIGSLTRRVSEETEQWRRKATVPIGRPIANTEVYILDRELKPVPVGVRGELYIGGAGVARGYLGRPELTAERFIPDLLSGEAGERLYRTGDVCRYLSDGEVEFIGRADDQVKLRGYRIELGEIEAVLNEHRWVRQSAVVAREDERDGKRLLGYVVGAVGATSAELKRYVRERLPEYMVPEAIVLLESMPLTANGKVDRKRLPTVESANRTLEQEDVIPRTPVEEIIAGIFKEVLKLGRVGIHDNFFEIGGHSLLATQVISRVRSVFGVEIGVGGIFEDATVEGLASRVEEALRAGERDEAPPLVRVERESHWGMRLPLSFAQQRLWFLDQLVPNNPFYNCPRSVRFEGRLDLEVLERVVNEIVRRHEVLRTRFEVEEGEPVQVIDPWMPRRLEREDLRSLPRGEREAEARRITSAEAETGFDLSRGPLLRVKVLKLGEQEHVVLYTMHHIVSDGWSMGILIREVGTLYKAYSAGMESPLEELPIQYADFAVWQRQWLQGEVLAAELTYWRKQLAGIEDLELPIDHPRPAVQSHRGARARFVVEREVAQKLRALSQREGASLFMVLLGGFDILMSRYSGQADVVVGTDIANRNRAEIEGLIGFFVNQLVLRVEVRARESFAGLLKRVREVCLGAYGHQDVPFEKLVEELEPERDLSRSPLFQAKLIMQNAERGGLELEGLRLSSGGGVEVRTTRLDLTVSITDVDMEVGRDLVGNVEYSRDLFEEETIERLMSHYANVLREILEDLERPISELRLLSEAEREQIVVEWNQTAEPYPHDRCIHELFREQAERSPERIALMDEKQQVSYQELNRRANQLAAHLQGLGVGPEVVVGLCLERSVEMVVALLGVLKAGGAYLPLGAESPLERLALMLEDAGVGVVLTERRLEQRLPAFLGQTVLIDEEWERISQESECEPEGGVAVENLAYVIYTSGSTGKPKGVMINHAGLVNYLRWATESYRMGEGGGAPVQSSIGFDLTVTSLYGPLVNGKRVNLLPEEEGIEALARALRQERGYSLVKITPAHLDVLAEQMRDTEVEGRARALVIGGEALRVGGLTYWRERARGTRLINEYGPTETVVGCCVYEVDGAELRREVVPIGKPIANTQIYILDEGMEQAPIGARGEIHISGAGLARGYMRRPELTGETFIPNRFGRKGGERMYRTGDIGRYLSDGNIEFIGRADRQVKVRGYRIELGEVEAVLNEHRSVRQSAVVAREDERGTLRLLGYVVGEEGATAAELKRYLRERLPEYMVPEAIVRLEEMPLTANGKVDKGALPEADEAAVAREREYVAPRGPVEEVLAGIWSEVLGVENVGVYDNFFELGGHSLLLTQVASRIRLAFSLDLPLRVLFDTPTIKQLSVAIATEQLIEADSTEASELLQELQRLSPEEIQAMLESELSEGFAMNEL